MPLAKLLRKALHPPLPGTPEAAAFEHDYAQVRGRFGVAGANDTSTEDQEDDEEEQERLLALWLRIRERQDHNAAVLRGVTQQRTPFHPTAAPRLPRDEQEQDEHEQE